MIVSVAQLYAFQPSEKQSPSNWTCTRTLSAKWLWCA